MPTPAANSPDIVCIGEADESESIPGKHKALDHGVNFLETAHH